MITYSRAPPAFLASYDTMPLSSTEQRHRLFKHIDLYGSKMPTACDNCEASGSVCRVDVRSGRCGECVRKNERKCNVAVTWSEFEKLRDVRLKLREKMKLALREHERLRDEQRRAREAEMASEAKLLRLQRQLFVAEEKEEAAVSTELRSLEESENPIEDSLTVTPSADDSCLALPADWSLFSLGEDFSWIPPSETVATASAS